MTDQQRLSQAIAHHKSGHFSEAEHAYKQLLTDSPNNAEILHLLAILYGQQNHHDLAQRYIEDVLKQGPQPPSIYVTAGNIARQNRQLDRAEQYFQHALTLNPDHATALHNLGVVYVYQKRLDDAIAAFEKTIEKKPDYADAYLHLGCVYVKQERWTDALTTFKKGCAIDGQHPLLWRHTGQIQQQLGQIDDAIVSYQSAIAIYPKEAMLHDLIGTAYAQIHRLDEAFDAFVIALKIDPHLTSAQHNLASLHFREKNHEKALKYWLKMLNDGPDDHTLYNIATAYASLKRWQDAKTYFEAQLKQHPNHVPSLVNLASLHIKHGQTDKALGYYQKALKIDPNSQQVRYVLQALEQNDAPQPQRAPDDYIVHLFNQYADDFDDHLQHQLSYCVPQHIADLLHEHVVKAPQQEILDLGCGTGLCGQHLKPWAKKLVGVDLSDQMLQQAAKKQIYDQLHESEIHRYLQTSAPFDLVVAGDVMPYFGDLAEILQAVHHITHPNGQFVFTVERYDGDDAFHLSSSARFQHNVPQLLDQATQLGWQVVASEPIVSRTQQNKPVSSQLILLKK